MRVKGPIAAGSKIHGSSQFPPRVVGAKPRFAPGRSPNVGPAGAKYLLPRSFPKVYQPPAQSTGQEEQKPVLPGPVPPSVYVIQSSSGFMRLSQENSRSRYSPDYLKDLADGGDPLAFLGASDQEDSRAGQKV